MKAAVFFDAFAECLVSVAIARGRPDLMESCRDVSVRTISARHGDAHAEATGRMFDKLFQDMQNPEEKR